MPVKLFRKKQGGLVLGLCAGLADSLGLNVWVLRLLFVCFSAFGGFGLIIYLTTSFALSLKESPKNESNRFLGLCIHLSRNWNVDVSVIRIVVTYVTLILGILPGVAVYLMVSLLMRLFRK